MPEFRCRFSKSLTAKIVPGVKQYDTYNSTPRCMSLHIWRRSHLSRSAGICPNWCQMLAFPLPLTSISTNVATLVWLHSPTISKFIGKNRIYDHKNVIQILRIRNKNIIELIKWFTERDIAWCM